MSHGLLKKLAGQMIFFTCFFMSLMVQYAPLIWGRIAIVDPSGGHPA